MERDSCGLSAPIRINPSNPCAIAANVEMGFKSDRRANRRVLIREEILAGESGNVLADKDEFW